MNEEKEPDYGQLTEKKTETEIDVDESMSSGHPTSSSAWQQALALDARYNAYRTTNYPNFRTLYIRRRSQLLRENAKLPSDPAIRKQYLAVRSQLLAERYGVTPSEGSTRSRSASLRSASMLTMDQIDLSDQSRPVDAVGSSNSETKVVPTAVADASRALVGDTTISDNYSFAGVHHVFEVHKGPVTRVRFANDERERFAVAGSDGCVSMCHIDGSTPVKLMGHDDVVTGWTDLCWSVSNDLLVSTSMDGTLRVWNPNSGECIRVIDDNQPVMCCLFQPLNNNLVVTGNQRGLVQVLNISTGKYIKSGQCKTVGAALSMCSESSGRMLWVGDVTGNVHAFLMDMATGKLVRAKRSLVCQGHAITSLTARSWLSREAKDLCVLASVANNMFCLYRASLTDGQLQFRRKFPIEHRKLMFLRSNFCPLMSFRQGACVLSGSEDGNVYLFDAERSSTVCINKLQAHAGAVTDVTFNHDESFLASGDNQGVVIVWKRDAKQKR